MTDRAAAVPRTARIFPFFVGRARSGTTLLRAIFDSHSQLAIPPESYFIPSLRRRRYRFVSNRSFVSGGGFDADAFVRQILEHPRVALWRLPEDEVWSAFRQVPPTTYADAVRRLFELYASRAGKPRYADKTPGYVYYMPLLARIFPESRFVHIIRDGRDAAVSFLATEFASGGVEEAAFAWRVGVSRGMRDGRRLGPSRYLEIRYENLVANPQPVLRAVTDFLDLTYESEMLDYATQADRILQGTNHPRAHQNLRQGPTKGMRDWRREMPKEDLITFELIAGTLLSRLGYERAVDTTSLPARSRMMSLHSRRVMRRLGEGFSGTSRGVDPSTPAG